MNGCVWSIRGIMLIVENQSAQKKKPVPMPLCTLQIPHWLSSVWTWGCVLRSEVTNRQSRSMLITDIFSESCGSSNSSWPLVSKLARLLWMMSWEGWSSKFFLLSSNVVLVFVWWDWLKIPDNSPCMCTFLAEPWAWNLRITLIDPSLDWRDRHWRTLMLRTFCASSF